MGWNLWGANYFCSKVRVTELLFLLIRRRLYLSSGLPPIMTATVGKRRALHRLIYKTLPQIAGQVSKLPQHVLKFEMELFGPLSPSTRATQEDLGNAPKIENMLSSAELNSSSDLPSSHESVSQSGSLSEALTNGWDSNYQVGRETYVNLMLPDRSVCHSGIN